MITQTTIVLKYILLRKRMMNEPYKYTERQVMHTVWRLIHVDPEIQRAFIEWFTDGKEPKLKYAGISFSELRKYRKMNEFNDFLFMDELKNNPDAALNMLVANDARLSTVGLDELRPELREYVAQKLKERDADDEKKKEDFQLHDNGSITFKLK